MTATLRVPPASDAARAVPDGDVVDIVVSRLVRVRLVDADPADRAAVEAQLGPAGAPVVGEADITLRYVDRLQTPDPMRLLGPGEVAVADGALVVLRGRFRRPARVRIPVAALGGPCELVCEHGVGRVPHLVAAVNLALPAHGGVALHASAVELDGRVVVATGWSKGGKTEAVLALLGAGGRLVGDEWLHLRPDGTVTGIFEPLRVWDWQLRQLPAVRRRTSRSDRARLRLLGLAVAASEARSARLSSALERQRFVDLDGDHLPQASGPPLPRGPVLLMTSALRDDIAVRPTTGREVADRMVASLAYERGPLRDLAEAHRFAFPEVPLPVLAEIRDQERALVRARLDGAPAFEVLHPHPMDLGALRGALLATLDGRP